jgi:hypothetical protein
MQVRFIQSISCGADDRYDLPECSFAPNSIAEIDDVLAGHWINSGICEEYKAPRGRKPAKVVPFVAPDAVSTEKSSGDLLDAGDWTAVGQDKDGFPVPKGSAEDVTSAEGEGSTKKAQEGE